MERLDAGDRLDRFRTCNVTLTLLYRSGTERKYSQKNAKYKSSSSFVEYHPIV